jgi:hypothetical protein
MREEVRKSGDETKVELKLAGFGSPFRVPRCPAIGEIAISITNQRAEWRLKDILVVA